MTSERLKEIRVEVKTAYEIHVVRRAARNLLAERDKLAAALKNIMDWGVQLDDERMAYIVAQIDRPSIRAAREALGKENPDAPTQKE